MPNYGVFDEKRYFAPGEAPCVFELSGVPVGLALCEDVWGPSVVERSRKAGAKPLLTTGNESEMSVGYSTLYGDMAGGFAPIKDAPKMLVYALARDRNTLSPVIPKRVIERPPSAELAPGQVDEDSLPPYAVLDEILAPYVFLPPMWSRIDRSKRSRVC